MIDQIYDRAYTHARTALNADASRAATTLGRTISDGLRALHRCNWSAPWADAPVTPHRG